MKILAVGRDPTLLAEVCACLNPHAGRLSARSKPYEWKMLRRCLRCIPSAYPEKYKPHLHEGGASFFAGKTDHPNFRYYVFNDYYNMECDDTLYNSCSFSVLVYPPIE